MLRKISLIPLCYFITCQAVLADYTWLVDPSLAPDSTTTNSNTPGGGAKYYQFNSSDVGSAVLYGKLTDKGVTVDYAIQLTEFTNSETFGQTTDYFNSDNSFAVYDDGGMDLFTRFVSKPFNADEANAKYEFNIQYYLEDSYSPFTNTGTLGAVGLLSMGSPLDDNTVAVLASDEEFELNWASGGTGTVHNPEDQVDIVRADGSLTFNAEPSITDVLSSNYGFFSEEDNSFSLIRQDRLVDDSKNGSTRTGLRSGITLGASSLRLPGSPSIDVTEAAEAIPEPATSTLLILGSFSLILRRRR